MLNDNFNLVVGAIVGAGAGLLASAAIFIGSAFLMSVGATVTVGYGILAAPVLIGMLEGMALGGILCDEEKLQEEQVAAWEEQVAVRAAAMEKSKPSHSRTISEEINPDSGSSPDSFYPVENKWRRQVRDRTACKETERGF